MDKHNDNDGIKIKTKIIDSMHTAYCIQQQHGRGWPRSPPLLSLSHFSCTKLGAELRKGHGDDVRGSAVVGGPLQNGSSTEEDGGIRWLM